jgi:hypothetical protein
VPFLENLDNGVGLAVPREAIGAAGPHFCRCEALGERELNDLRAQ